MDYDTCYWRGTDMKTTLRFMVLPVGVCLLWLTSAARAENFVQVFYDEEGQVFAEVDVDSIQKDSDGFTLRDAHPVLDQGHYVVESRLAARRPCSF
jgi:hypothetical protein